jgi:hypothetical protein
VPDTAFRPGELCRRKVTHDGSPRQFAATAAHPARPVRALDYGEGIMLSAGESARFVCAGDSALVRAKLFIWRLDHAGCLRTESRHHLPRCPYGAMASRSRARRISLSECPPGRRSIGICAAKLKWTIVVLRDGRRSRPWRADVAQLVAHHLAKVRVAGSNPVIRSKVQVASTPAVEWPSGEATACKAVHTGSIPVSTSKGLIPARLAQRESASLTRKRSLVQSQYRAPVFLQFRRFWSLGSIAVNSGRGAAFVGE